VHDEEVDLGALLGDTAEAEVEGDARDEADELAGGGDADPDVPVGDVAGRAQGPLEEVGRVVKPLRASELVSAGVVCEKREG
jgi:hypothetical protein